MKPIEVQIIEAIDEWLKTLPPDLTNTANMACVASFLTGASLSTQFLIGNDGGVTAQQLGQAIEHVALTVGLKKGKLP